MTFLADRSGVTAIEYALIAVIVSISIVGGATAIGTNLTTILQNTAAGFTP